MKKYETITLDDVGNIAFVNNDRDKYEDIIKSLYAMDGEIAYTAENMEHIGDLAHWYGDETYENLANALCDAFSADEAHDMGRLDRMLESYKNEEYFPKGSEEERVFRAIIVETGTYDRYKNYIELVAAMREERIKTADATLDLSGLTSSEMTLVVDALETINIDIAEKGTPVANAKIELESDTGSCFASADIDGINRMVDVYTAGLSIGTDYEFDLKAFSREKIEEMAEILEQGVRGEIIDFDFYDNPMFVLRGDKLMLQNDELTQGVILTEDGKAARLYELTNDGSSQVVLGTYEELKDMLYSFVADGFAVDMDADKQLPIYSKAFGELSEIARNNRDNTTAVLCNKLAEYYDLVEHDADKTTLDNARREFLNGDYDYIRDSIEDYKAKHGASQTAEKKKPQVERD